MSIKTFLLSLFIPLALGAAGLTFTFNKQVEASTWAESKLVLASVEGQVLAASPDEELSQMHIGDLLGPNYQVVTHESSSAQFSQNQTLKFFIGEFSLLNIMSVETRGQGSNISIGFEIGSFWAATKNGTFDINTPFNSVSVKEFSSAQVNVNRLQNQTIVSCLKGTCVLTTSEEYIMTGGQIVTLNEANFITEFRNLTSDELLAQLSVVEFKPKKFGGSTLNLNVTQTEPSVIVTPIRYETGIRSQNTLCEFPEGWDIYVVQAGDTLASIANSYHTTAYDLQLNNCLEDQNVIVVGQELYVPLIQYTPKLTSDSLNVSKPSSTPLPTLTPVPPLEKSATLTKTEESSPSVNTSLLTTTHTGEIPTNSPTPTQTQVPPTPTLSPTMSPTPLPTSSPTPNFRPTEWDDTSRSPGCETRAVWLNPEAFRREDVRKSTLQKLKQANINTIFVLAPPVGGNKGWSNPEHFTALVNAAVAEGISVHGWIANMYRLHGIASDDWMADFTNPTEQDAQAQWAIDLLTAYPKLSGVHFDYIRYIDWDWVDKAKINGVTATVRKTNKVIDIKFPGKVLTASVLTLKPDYFEFENEYVPQWFLDWYVEGPQNWYDSSYPAHQDSGPIGMKYQQNPVEWINNNYIDYIVSMQYWTDDSLWIKSTAHWVEFTKLNGNKSNRVIMGLGWFKSDHVANPEHVIRKINYGRQMGINGFSIFEFSAKINGVPIDDYLLIEVLTVDSELNNWNAPFKTYVPSCLP